MIYGRENIMQYYDAASAEGNHFWAIYPKNNTAGGNCIIRSSESEATTPGENRNKLLQALNLHHGVYTFVCTDKPGIKAKGTWRDEIELPMNNQSMAMQHTANVSGITHDEVKMQVIAGIEDYKKTQRLAELEKENEALKKANQLLEKQAEAPLNKIMGIAEPMLPQLIPAIIGKIFPQMQGIAGVPQPIQVSQQQQQDANETQQYALSELEQERVSNALGRLAQVVGENWIDKLEKLAVFVEKNPAMINVL